MEETNPKSIKVGCYYFTNWESEKKWTSVKAFKTVDLEPILGYYKDGLPEVQDWHIGQATEHGISFWIFDWYYDIAKNRGYRKNNVALDQGFLHASRRKEMEFAVMWCNEESDFTGYTEQQLLDMVKTMGEHYLHLDNYLKTPDGRNVVSMTRPDRLIGQFGYEGTKKLLQAMHEEAKPWGGLFFMTIKYPTVEELRLLKNAGFDACTLYSYSNEGMKPGQLEGPYNAILPWVEPIWRSGFENGALPVVPLVSPNWDSRPWAGLGGRGTWRSGSTPEKFEQMCNALKAYVDPYLNLALVGTWNEFGEGSHIEPTKLHGCSYLDALQRAFFPERYKPHSVAVPTESELAFLDYDDIPPADEGG